MNFEKWHGIGNDFLIVQNEELKTDSVVAICNRNFGIGADGVLVLEESDTADARMLIHNADGSMAEMCGNGIRVAARFLVEHGVVTPNSEGSFSIETAGGIMHPTILADGRVRVDMGLITTEGVETLELDMLEAEKVSGRIVSAGNPHFVVRRTVGGGELHRIGPILENHPRFPNRTNVEFWEILDEDKSVVRMRVWERGVGETLACGTGACAVAFTALTDSALKNQPVVVKLPGGDLEIEFKEGRAFMTGAAHYSWSGSVDPEDVLSGMPATNSEAYA